MGPAPTGNNISRAMLGWGIRCHRVACRVQVLTASPSVPVEFHDRLPTHHSQVVPSYPRHWTPPPASHPGPPPGLRNEHRDEHRNEKRDNDRL